MNVRTLAAWMRGEVSEPARSWLLLLPRVALGLSIAWVFGLPKFTHFESYLREVSSSGVPLPSVVGVALATVELVGGVMLAVGFCTRAASASIMLAMLGILAVAKQDTFPWDVVVYVQGGYVYAVLAPGPLSLDDRLSRRRSNKPLRSPSRA